LRTNDESEIFEPTANAGRHTQWKFCSPSFESAIYMVYSQYVV